MNHQKVKLLYIGGYARCGSTILSNVLGEIDGFFNAGELMYIWDRMISSEGNCGCGDHVTACKIWKNVIHNAYGGKGGVDCEKMIHLRNSVWQSKNIPLWMWLPYKEKQLIVKIKDYLEALELFYSAIGSELSEDVIIDSSKNPAYLFLLSLVSVVDVYVVHIVRDSRATAYSWLRNKKGFSNINSWKSSLSWNARNSAFDFLNGRFRGKYLQIRYEDFVANPKKGLNTILKLVNEEQRSLDFIKEEGILFGENHCVFGNPDLFKKGKLKLRLDGEWKHMKKRDWMITTGLTWPLLKRYGYSVF